MAGVVKHMQRSHYSYHKNDGVFRQFNMKAYQKKQKKENRKTFGQMLKQLVKGE